MNQIETKASYKMKNARFRAFFDVRLRETLMKALP